MAVVSVDSWTIYGAQAVAVQVEVNISNGLPCFTLVGLAETAVKESRERVRAAIQNSGFDFPSNKRLTVNLAPADLPKESGRFDLPIALAILAASQQISIAKLQQFNTAGELSLTGDIRPVHGALLMALTMLKQNEYDINANALLLPFGSAQEAALIESVEVYQGKNLLEVANYLQDIPHQQKQQQLIATVERAVAPIVQLSTQDTQLDYKDVKGQTIVKRVLEIAAVGGHSLLMVGPPGSGKSMLAQRFATILPLMTEQEALESAAILSLDGRFKLQQWCQRPFWAPHHSASAVALIGGGSPPRPGEVSLAHQGVLFLDELPEFSRQALEALREPLEAGIIRIARANHRFDFPARFQLIAAMNPCPCGYQGSKQKACYCTPDQVARYQKKLSGPLLDRIDLFIEVAALPSKELLQPNEKNEESSGNIRQRVCQAREFSQQRQGILNSRLVGKKLEQYTKLTNEALTLLERAADRMNWSARSMHRVIRVSRSIADLSSSEQVQGEHLAEAIQYKRALLQAALQ